MFRSVPMKRGTASSGKRTRPVYYEDVFGKINSDEEGEGEIHICDSDTETDSSHSSMEPMSSDAPIGVMAASLAEGTTVDDPERTKMNTTPDSLSVFDNVSVDGRTAVEQGDDAEHDGQDQFFGELIAAVLDAGREDFRDLDESPKTGEDVAKSIEVPDVDENPNQVNDQVGNSMPKASPDVMPRETPDVTIETGQDVLEEPASVQIPDPLTVEEREAFKRTVADADPTELETALDKIPPQCPKCRKIRRKDLDMADLHVHAQLQLVEFFEQDHGRKKRRRVTRQDVLEAAQGASPLPSSRHNTRSSAKRQLEAERASKLEGMPRTRSRTKQAGGAKGALLPPKRGGAVHRGTRCRRRGVYVAVVKRK